MSGSRKRHHRALPAPPAVPPEERTLRLTPPSQPRLVGATAPAETHADTPVAPEPVAAPAASASVPPGVASPAPSRATRRSVPVAQRPWRVLVVPPTPGAPTRAFDVARWQARLAVGALAIGTVVVAATVLAVFAAFRDPDFLGGSDERRLLRERVALLEDSLALSGTVIAELSGAEESAPPVAAPAAPAERDRARPLAIGALSRGGSATRERTRDALRAAREARAARSTRGAFTLGGRDSDDGAAPVAGSADGLPVAGAIASGFSNARRHPLLRIVRPHLGVDVRAPTGTRISAPAAGRVTFVGRRFAYGLVVEIAHADGAITRYAHCRSALVREGADVVRGTPIATVGSSGITTGPHLHYEVLVGGRQVDPMTYRLPGTSGGAAPAQSAPGAAGSLPPVPTAPAVPLPGGGTPAPDAAPAPELPSARPR